MSDSGDTNDEDTNEPTTKLVKVHTSTQSQISIDYDEEEETESNVKIYDPSKSCKCNAMPPPEMMDNLKNQPKFLIEGKWSPIAYIYLVIFLCAMGFGATYAIPTYPSYIDTSTSFIQFIWRFIIFLYGICILCWIFKREGLWPLWSFTIMSWNLFILRYLFSSLYHLGGDSKQFPVLFALSESLRFPSLVCNTITGMLCIQCIQNNIQWICCVNVIFL